MIQIKKDNIFKNVYKNESVKNVIDSDEIISKSIKSIVVKNNLTVKVTTRFMNGKMLMFYKVSLKRSV